jgi:hypothetical protein
MQTPIRNEIWQHHSGRLYEIVCVANEKAESWETEVVYRDVDGNVWARPLAVFFEEVQAVAHFATCRRFWRTGVRQSDGDQIVCNTRERLRIL